MERGTTRGRPKGSGTRGRGKGKGKRGRKPRFVSDEEEIETNPNIQAEQNTESEKNDTETKSPAQEAAAEELPMEVAQEDDLSQLELEAPSFTTMQRNIPQQVILRLNWDHKVNLIGEKVLNPMIYVCDQCSKPILIYGRMIPCKHVFCLTCARTEAVSKQCPRCKDKVLRVERTGLGTVFMCTHGGTRYGNSGCRRTYLSQRDLQAHINHRHVTVAVVPTPQLQDINKTTEKTSAAQQQNSHIRKDSVNQSSNNNKQQFNSSSSSASASNMFQSSRINDHHQQQMTPTKMSFHHNNSQDNHGFYNQQQQHMNYGGNQYNNNNFGAGTSNNFYQQQPYQNIGHYSQGQQHQQNWNQQQYFR